MKPFLLKSMLRLSYGSPRKVEDGFRLDNVRKILLIRRNGIGDMICALPLIRNLRAALPQVHIDILASDKNACVIYNLGLVNQIHLYERGKGIFRNHYLNLHRIIRPIRKERYDLLIAIKGGFSPLLAVISWASGIPWRLGYVPSKGHPMDFVFNLKIELPVEREHQIESCLRFLHPLGILPSEGRDVSIRLEEAHRAHAAEIIRKSHLDPRRFVLINVSSGRMESRWTPQAAAEFARGIHQRFGLRTLLCGLPGEYHILNEIQRSAGTEVVPAVIEPPTMHDFAALAEQSRFLLCGDGGPMHIAAAVGCPVFVLFSATDPRIWRPYGVPFGYIQEGRLVSDLSAERVLESVSAWLQG
jgi:heptosyltransferase III